MALKTFRPTTPGLRHVVLVDRSHLWKGAPVKMLTEGKTKTGGRNNLGRITSRHNGGGHKQAYRLVDFNRGKFDVAATVERLEYDPNRTAYIALVKYADGEQSYILAPQRLARRRSGDVGRQGRREARQRHAAAAMPIGTIVHNIEMKAGGGGQLRAPPAPTFSLSAAIGLGDPEAQLGRDAPGARRVHGDRRRGVQSRSLNRSTGKAGRTRWRETVRPCARSP